MKVKEADRNALLLAAVTLFSVAVAGVVSLLEPASVPAIQKPVYVADQTPVRVIGTPFVPNTTPREH